MGREVTADQVLSMAQVLQDYNIIFRRRYGSYAATDPFVHRAWREHIAALDAPGTAS